ncbi:hypothetical protein [Abyssogena phaseoliformis symbiont]|uniref:hypothetical protein n=1 Tax=Abyssogena phaseoliformis symbiont TaxID=596095 RepID=UPI0019168D06|nr:hypothetical protein [Abyssogena phaseoliformis symbiont]MBW5288587.1 hypothetical protein [Candidatus Ruthia sp. Apha_13_S6]
MATINEMRNMVNVMADIKKGYAGNVGESWQSTPIFADFGSIATFNVAYTGGSLPTTNHFSNEAG